uniref:Uncharacterized protein n=1 Tax=Megaselia scalaris TaxID=36166 RepID=T1GMX7_MEGSC
MSSILWRRNASATVRRENKLHLDLRTELHYRNEWFSYIEIIERIFILLSPFNKLPSMNNNFHLAS